MIRLLMVDRHAVLRDGLRHILEKSGEFEIDGEAGDAAAAFELVKHGRAEIALIDQTTLGRECAELIHRIRGTAPSTRILVMAARASQRHAAAAFQAGASGYLTKQSGCDELIAALRKIAAGGVYVSMHVAEQLAENLHSPSDADAPPHERLSKREFEVFRHLAAGDTPAEIAQALGISAKTVRIYKAHVLDKLELPNETALVRYAVAHRIGDPL
ncbi:response regulator transcription factor [Burkholderia thailandensis]|uniref:Bacterial regulatory, luxR family protein n=3 Tax=Burkholderia thailandensis TaxID=57975 RepID=A0AAW9CV54_BURTH|nr:response regulator transcription factor [Burkholderia thailandensis]ABC34604.1 DNA-binding response regulator, LuxR family [Burkholderia thailandensis E264]AHI76799.1 bacterial regulatory s, luxR family protein [Burkholderia thailandensis 2002721723]AHI81040.1 bacterial regulatory s, luxR family protein [Burkholderia thailandensis E444]AIC89479.1 bacterial regulatory s, luxR family protein [Burkholderia thailandensis USAMRU Malaysia \